MAVHSSGGQQISLRGCDSAPVVGSAVYGRRSMLRRHRYRPGLNTGSWRTLPGSSVSSDPVTTNCQVNQGIAFGRTAPVFSGDRTPANDVEIGRRTPSDCHPVKGRQVWRTWLGPYPVAPIIDAVIRVADIDSRRARCGTGGADGGVRVRGRCICRYRARCRDGVVDAANPYRCKLRHPEDLVLPAFVDAGGKLRWKWSLS